MTRSTFKGPVRKFNNSTENTVTSKAKKGTSISTPVITEIKPSRDTLILPSDISTSPKVEGLKKTGSQSGNASSMIHNGKRWIRLKLTESMIGHRFGEFASTRKKFIFKKKK